MTRQDAIIYIRDHGKSVLGQKKLSLANSFAQYGDWSSVAEVIAGDESDAVLNMLADALWEGKR